MNQSRYEKLVNHWILGNHPMSDLIKALESLTVLEEIETIAKFKMVLTYTKHARHAIEIKGNFKELSISVKEASEAMNKLITPFKKIKSKKPKKQYNKYNTHYSNNKHY